MSSTILLNQIGIKLNLKDFKKNIKDSINKEKYNLM